MSFPPLVAFLLYEVGLFAAAWRIALLLSSREPLRPSWAMLYVLSAKLYLGGVLSLLVLFFVPQPAAGFRVLCGALALGAMLLLPGLYRRGMDSGEPWSRREKWLGTAMAVGFGVCLAGSAHPLRDYDSLHNLNWIIRWLVDGRSPYEFAFNYVSFWEAQFVPGLLLGNSRYLHIWLSAQALLLYAIALYVLARTVDLNRLVALSIVAVAVFLPWHWGFAAGISTLKNDTLANAGFLIAIVAVVRTRRMDAADWRAGAVLGIALTFVALKYSGTVAALPFLLAMLALPWIDRNHRFQDTAAACLIAIAVAAVAVGHFYLRNWLAHDNPLYPFALSFGPLSLAGPMSEPGTSIVANLKHDRAWKLLLGVDPMGRPELLLVRAGVLACMLVVLTRLVTRRTPRFSLVATAAFALWGWFIWLVSTWSAGIAPGNLVYLEELRSLRYATGALGASLVVLAATVLLLRVVRPSWVAAILVVLACAQAVQLLVIYLPIAGWISPLAIALSLAAIVALCAAAAAAIARRPAVRRYGLVAATCASASTLVAIEALAPSRYDPYAPIRGFVESSEPRRIVIYRPANKSEASFFSGLGYHLLAKDVSATLPALSIHDEVPTRLPTGSDGDVLVVHGLGPSDARFQRYKADFERRIAGSRLKPAYADAYGAVYRWSGGTP